MKTDGNAAYDCGCFIVFCYFILKAFCAMLLYTRTGDVNIILDGDGMPPVFG